jgi:hypothetical protein
VIVEVASLAAVAARKGQDTPEDGAFGQGLLLA